MRPVCTACQREMEVEKIGLAVGITVKGSPYQVWSGDLYKCGGCGVTIVARFGRGPNWERHYPEPRPALDVEVLA